MLQTQTIEPGTLDILRKLMKVDELSTFQLVGGTALSLQYGHRISADLDLFSTKEFETQFIATVLERHFQNFTYLNVTNPIGLFGANLGVCKKLHPAKSKGLFTLMIVHSSTLQV